MMSEGVPRVSAVFIPYLLMPIVRQRGRWGLMGLAAVVLCVIRELRCMVCMKK